MDNVTTQPTDNSSFNLLTPLITPVLFVMFNHLGVTRQVLSAIREKLLQGCVSNINAHIDESEHHHFLMFLLKVNCVFLLKTPFKPINALYFSEVWVINRVGEMCGFISVKPL
mgnify:CR=1 FL=1